MTARERPPWLALLAPLPADAVPERKPVASAEQIAHGTAGPIAGWESLSINLSDLDAGLRNVHLTLDASGTVIAGGDHVMFIRETTPDGSEVTRSEHESIGGRFETDGAFNGTRWHSRLISKPGSDEEAESQSTSFAPVAEEVSALRALVAEVMRRAHRR